MVRIKYLSKSVMKVVCQCCQTFHELFSVSLLPFMKKRRLHKFTHEQKWGGSHLFSSDGERETSQAAETRTNRRSHHRGEIAMRMTPGGRLHLGWGEKSHLRCLCFCFGSSPTQPSLSRCPLSQPPPPPGCFGMCSDVSHRGGGGWFVTWTDTWCCCAVWEWVTCSKWGFSEVGVLGPDDKSIVPFVSMSLVVGVGGHFSQLFWVKRWMWRKGKKAEDRWTGQVESW